MNRAHEGWVAHVVDDAPSAATLVYLLRRREDGGSDYAVEVEAGGHVVVKTVPEGQVGLPFLRLERGSSGILAALAEALVEHAPAQSATESALAVTLEALDYERGRVDDVLDAFTKQR